MGAKRELWKRRAVYAVMGGWPVGSVLLIVVATFVSGTLFGAAERTFRLTGMVLQIVGFIMTIWQILETRRALGLPTWFESVRNYFKGFPAAGETISMSAEFAPFNVTMSATATVHRDPKAKVEDRLARLERDVDGLRDQIGSLDSKHASEISSIKQDLSRKAEELRTQMSEIQSRFEELIGGSTTPNTVGIFYFVVGLVLASASVELAAFVKAS